MKLILVLTVVMLGLQSASSLNITLGELKDIAMKMKNATQYVSEANSALKAEDVGKFINAIGNLVSLIPGPVGIIGGGVLGLVAAFIPGAKVPTELSIVLGELNKVSDKLHDLSNTVQEAKGELTAEIRKTLLASYEKYMDEIDGDYKEVLKRSSEARKSQLISTCDKNSYHTIARWFKDELEGKHSTSSIVSLVRAPNDRKAYFNFAKVLIGNFVRATVLQTACTSVIYASKPPQELDAILAEDATEYQAMLEAMKNKLQEEDDKIVDTFWETATSDIEKLAKGKNSMAHSQEANIFLQKLQEKFYWRQWVVIVYGDQDTAGFKAHKHLSRSVIRRWNHESYFKLWVRLDNKNIVVASPEPNVPKSFKDQAWACIEKVKTNPGLVYDCEKGLSIVDQCMGDTLYSSIGCVRYPKEKYAVAKDSESIVEREVTSSYLASSPWGTMYDYQTFRMYAIY